MTAIDTLTALTDPTAQARQRAEANAAERQQVADEIKKVGFRQYVEGIQEEKLKELREKILAAMGLTEEDLNAMPAKQRNAIESAISEEIKRRLEAASAVNGNAQTDGSTMDANTLVAASDASAKDKLMPGFTRLDMSILTALEEAENAAGTVAYPEEKA